MLLSFGHRYGIDAEIFLIMINLKQVLQTNGSFCVIYKLGLNLIPEILLVQRKQNQMWELPGGQVDYDTDDPNDPFESAAIRESMEECGIPLNPVEVECEMFLQQLKKHNEDWLVGTVGLYSCLIRNSKTVDLTFTSEETSAIKFVSVMEIDFKDEYIMLAARRMIAHFCVNLSGSSKRAWGGNLGNKISFSIQGEIITV